MRPMDVVLAILAGAAMLGGVGWVFHRGIFAERRPREGD